MLTQEQKRIKIAEACGWKHGTYRSDCYKGDGWLLPGENAQSALQKGNAVAWSARELPDYFNDLNAMHGAEEHLGGVLGRYFDTVSNIVEDDTRMGWALTATAEQRAEAFGQTLGIWKAGE